VNIEVNITAGISPKSVVQLNTTKDYPRPVCGGGWGKLMLLLQENAHEFSE